MTAPTGSTPSTGPVPTTASATGCRSRATTRRSGRSMKPLLANPALKPAAGDVQSATAQAQDLLRLRFSTRCSGSGRPDQINAKVTFPASGTADAQPGRDRDADRRHRGARRRPAAQGPRRGVQRLADGRDPEGARPRRCLAGPVAGAGRVAPTRSSRPPPGTRRPARRPCRRAPWRCSSSADPPPPTRTFASKGSSLVDRLHPVHTEFPLLAKVAGGASGSGLEGEDDLAQEGVELDLLGLGEHVDGRLLRTTASSRACFQTARPAWVGRTMIRRRSSGSLSRVT